MSESRKFWQQYRGCLPAFWEEQPVHAPYQKADKEYDRDRAAFTRFAAHFGFERRDDGRLHPNLSSFRFDIGRPA